MIINDVADTVPGALLEAHTQLDALWQSLHQPTERWASHLGEALIKRGLIGPELLQRAIKAQERTTPHRHLGALLVETGVITQDQLNRTLAEWMGVHIVDPRPLVP